MPRDQETDAEASGRAGRLGGSDSAAEPVDPVAGPPGESGTPDFVSPDFGAPDPGTPDPDTPEPHGAATGSGRRIRFVPASEPDPDSTAGQRLRRRRRLFIAGIAVAAAIVAIALCAGAVSIIAAVHDARDRVADARDSRQIRDAACLELEQRLNRLTPPGAAGPPQARATAVQSENAAVRIYVGEIGDQRTQDAWRQLLDSRTTYAEALTQQAKTRTPAFYIAPRTGNGRALADELAGLSPASCAGSIRRLAAPDL